MKSDISVVVLSSSRKKKQALVVMLAEYGWRTHSCEEPAEVYRHVRQLTESSAAAVLPVLLILTDIDARSRTVMSCLRALFPDTAILLLNGDGTDPTLADCFQMGVDLWAPETASVELLVAMLLGLARRQAAWQNKTRRLVAAPGKASGRWVLDEHGWRLLSPNGVGVPLTTSERTFLVTLLSMPDRKASRELLLQAMQGLSEAERPNQKNGRLCVMVSRLRRKTEKCGLTLPVKSLYSWGYMFTGDT